MFFKTIYLLIDYLIFFFFLSIVRVQVQKLKMTYEFDRGEKTDLRRNRRCTCSYASSDDGAKFSDVNNDSGRVGILKQSWTIIILC